MKIVIIGLFSIALSSCGVKLVGNVYKLNPLVDATGGQQDLIRGIRIDDIRNDTLLVKYKFSNELFLDADLVYDNKLKCYKSINKLVMGVTANKTSDVYLKFGGKKKLYIEFVDLLKNRTIQYQKVYKMKIDLKTHRDAYYAEDGFSL